LREAKANLSELVERAAAGEEILITVHGRPKARLVAMNNPDSIRPQMAGWADRLQHLQKKYAAAPATELSVIEELRDERW
jgi:prevent-host-death family protein